MGFSKLAIAVLLGLGTVGGLGDSVPGPPPGAGAEADGRFAGGSVAAELRSTAVLAAAPAIVATEELEVEAVTGRRLWYGAPYTGTARTYFTSGEIATEDVFVAGRREGLRRRWFQDGTLAYRAEYVDGRAHGLSETWWKNGNPRSRATYHEGHLHGVCEQWYRTGEPFKRLSYEGGRESGLQQAWRQNGELYCNYVYRNGRTYGLKKSSLCFGVKNEKIQLSSL